MGLHAFLPLVVVLLLLFPTLAFVVHLPLTMTGSVDKPLVTEGVRMQPSPSSPTQLQKGRLLVAKPWEYNHFTSKSCLFLYRHDPDTGSRAVVLERPTVRLSPPPPFPLTFPSVLGPMRCAVPIQSTPRG